MLLVFVTQSAYSIIILIPDSSYEMYCGLSPLTIFCLSNFIVFILDYCIPGPIEVKLLCLMKVRLLVLELDGGSRLVIVVVLASVVMPIINDIHLYLSQ